MKQFMTIFLLGSALISCNEAAEKKAEDTQPAAGTTAVATPAVDLPFTASYSSHFTTDVSDADLKTVLNSYVYWKDGDMDKLAGIMGDTATIELADGTLKVYANNELKAYWKSHRDSLSSVDIAMEAWQKLHSDKGDDIVLTWYIEKDTYKTGKVDSAYYHDINIIKNGKITLYSTYKKPKKQ